MIDRKIAFDIAGLITNPYIFNTTKELFERYHEVDYMEPTTIGILQKIVFLFGSKNVFIVSKCRQANEPMTRDWFDKKKFFPETGILESNLHFTRTKRDKTFVAVQEGITHFVDNEYEVLFHMKNLVPFRFAFKPKEPKNPLEEGFKKDIGDIVLCDSWQELFENIK